jgi:hypothetical protein
MERAAGCYLRSGLPGEAARCLREAGAYRRSAELWWQLGQFTEAAEDYALGGMTDVAAWVLVHDAGDTAAARVVAGSGGTLRTRLALAHCDVNDGRLDREPLRALASAADQLATPAAVYDQLVEEWAVAVAGVMRRYDQVALVYAAAVRGRRRGAAERWTAWAARVLQTEITLPELPQDGRRSSPAGLRRLRPTDTAGPHDSGPR